MIGFHSNEEPDRHEILIAMTAVNTVACDVKCKKPAV
jgi:hypothetical protein